MEHLSDDELLAELKRRFDENKRALAVITVMNTKLENLNNRLAESERLKSNFLTNIRNEINNPLSAIMGLAETIMATDFPSTHAARLIHTEAARLDYQLRNIFAVAELEAGECEPTISRVKLATLIQNVIEAHRYRAEEKRVSVTLHAPADLDTTDFLTAPDKLELILSNLLSNAIEFSHEGGQVTIRVETGHGLLNISVKDEGIGIAEKDQARIFNRFVQLETGHKKTHHGHGLGLSLVKALLDRLNGTITVESRPGEGSVFSILLPEKTGSEENVYSEYGRDFLFEEKGDLEVF